MKKCMRCGKELDDYDMGIYRKLIHRGAEEFLCRDCLALNLGMTRAHIDELIRKFQAQGCQLFPPPDFQ